ncbi:uncharacterized protein [Haliotis asinina]|uniref:uncharacterized protein n=1 Tax=Haliotis asinina TaxID=109174 RepID=UPI0035319FBD
MAYKSIVTYTRDSGADGGYQQIEETGYADYRLVSYHREDENDGSYQEIEGNVNVDDIVPIVAVYSVMLTAVAVVVAAVTVLVCKDVKDYQGRRCGDYLTVMAERLSHDFSDVPRASNNDILPLHDYERLLREQFHIYTSLHPSSSSTEDHKTADFMPWKKENTHILLYHSKWRLPSSNRDSLIDPRKSVPPYQRSTTISDAAMTDFPAQP